MKKAVLSHPAGMIKTVKAGYSWTTMIFGLFVPLLRGDYKWTVILVILDLLMGSVSFGIGIGIGNFLFAFMYNRIYITDLLQQGYEPRSERDAKVIARFLG